MGGGDRLDLLTERDTFPEDFTCGGPDSLLALDESRLIIPLDDFSHRVVSQIWVHSS
jgi:hypothetical protein